MSNQITRFDGEFSFLSNFYLCWIPFEGHTYASVEHAYQASKTFNPKMREMIRLAPTPGRAKRAGQILTLRSDWNDVKVAVMEELLREKFRSVRLQILLRETGDRPLIEGNSWNDFFWGVCKGKGLNHLGKLLMKIRSELA